MASTNNKIATHLFNLGITLIVINNINSYVEVNIKGTDQA